MAKKAKRNKAAKAAKATKATNARDPRSRPPAPPPAAQQPEDGWHGTREFLKKRSAFLLLLAAIGALTVLTGLTLEKAEIRLLYSEGQLIENATVLLYGAALALLLGWSNGERELRLLIALVVSLCAFRELDLHKAYTSESLFKISYYIRGDDPIMGRVVAGIIVVAILALLFRTLIYCRNLFKELWAGRPFAYSALTAILLLPFSKALDSGPRMIHKHFDIDLPADVRLWLQVAEETLEFAIPLLIVLSVAQFNIAKLGAGKLKIEPRKDPGGS